MFRAANEAKPGSSQIFCHAFSFASFRGANISSRAGEGEIELERVMGVIADARALLEADRLVEARQLIDTLLDGKLADG